MFEDILKNINVQNENGDLNYVLILFSIIVVTFIIRNVIVNALYHKTEDAQLKYNVKKVFTYIVLTLTFVLIAFLYVIYYQYLGTLLGLFSAGLAVALKDPISNIAGWLYIIATRPFEVGDRIKIGDSSGDVIDIRTTHFTMLEIGEWVDSDQSTGRIIHVPNGAVMLKEIINYSRGYQYIWDELSIVVTFESNWKDAKYILSEILLKHTEHLSKRVKENIKEANKKYAIVNFKYLTPIVYTKVVDNGVKLTMRFLTEPRNRRTMEHKIWEEILEKFSHLDDVEMAYPTSRIFNKSIEQYEGINTMGEVNRNIN